MRSPLFQTVEELDLFSTDVGDRGLEALADSPWGPRLRCLKLGGFGSASISGPGVVALARSQHARSLNVIDFDQTYDDDFDAVARDLVEAPGLERITRIVVSQPSALEILRTRWGPRVVAPERDELEI